MRLRSQILDTSLDGMGIRQTTTSLNLQKIRHQIFMTYIGFGDRTIHLSHEINLKGSLLKYQKVLTTYGREGYYIN